MEAPIIGRILSAIFSRWTVTIIAVAFVIWHIHLRIDQLGAEQLESTHVSVVTTMAVQ
jgi:hypothetical protein